MLMKLDRYDKISLLLYIRWWNFLNELTINFSNKRLCSLILPLIVEQFLAITVGLADSIMVASVGEAAVSAVSLVDSINTLVFYGFAALATGGAVVCGQFIGSRDLKKANDSAEQLLVFIVLLAAGLGAIRVILHLMKVPLKRAPLHLASLRCLRMMLFSGIITLWKNSSCNRESPSCCPKFSPISRTIA